MNKQQEFEALAQEVREEKYNEHKETNKEMSLGSSRQFLLGSIIISVGLIISTLILIK